jgi:hypothetical protein
MLTEVQASKRGQSWQGSDIDHSFRTLSTAWEAYLEGKYCVIDCGQEFTQT